MIKTILVALDPDTDTPVATRHAGEIAKRYDADVTGLAVIDMGSIEAGTRGGGIGSMYLMDDLRKNLTDEARDKAHDLIAEFADAMDAMNVRYDAHVKEGVPFERIVEDAKYHDLVVVGREPHFFYSHPEEKTETLERAVREAVAPVFVVGNRYQSIKRVLIAYDGSDPSARTLQRYVHLCPFGRDATLELIHVYPHGGKDDAELMLKLARDYLKKHNFDARVSNVGGDDPAEVIAAYARKVEADALVLGGHSVSKIRQMAFGSTTASLLDACPVPLFLYH
ncbi:MAG: universal stress protein [Bacteroidetes bacterium]|jgi:nucleotide-binding universal stress UspA family protein|nr:universal stress protein [Bacteroidota bacterium]